MPPKVSIVIPVYNVEKYLAKALDSAIGQTLHDIEIVCVEDGSTDGSAALLREYGQRDHRIHCLWHESNLGTFQALNDGILASTGQYVMFLDPDDLLEPNACETAFWAIERYGTNVVHFGASIVSVDDAENLAGLAKWLKPLPGKLKSRDNLLRSCLKNRLDYILWNKIFHADICRKAVALGKMIHNGRPNELYLFFLIACLSTSYCGIEAKLYIHQYGAGAHGHRYWTLKDFTMVCRSQSGVVRALKGGTLPDTVDREERRCQNDEVKHGLIHVAHHVLKWALDIPLEE